MTMKRRDALKTLGAMTGAASTAPLISACGSDGETGSAKPPGIDTFVFLMMENRSYDHYMGARSLIEGKPGDGLSAETTQVDIDGMVVAPWQAELDGLCTINPPHGWNAGRTQLGDNANDGFLLAHQSSRGNQAIEPMLYLVREQQPVTYALADAYTSCDRWFSSVLGPTLPNRMYWHAGTSNGAQTNRDVSSAFQGVTTLYHRLDEVGVDWAYYFGDLPVLGVLDDIDITGRVRRFLPDFLDDAEAGRLPPVVYIDPAFSWNDDHPPSHPLLGQQLIASVYQALATSPHWEHCMLVISYDEHGGFFDHVVPPKVTDDLASEGFDQLGFRVPSLIVGPYVKSGYVSSVQYDHTSPLKHLENELSFAPLTARSSAANDLSDAIDFDRLAAGEPLPPIELPAVEVDEAVVTAPQCTGHGDGGGPFVTWSKHGHDVLAWAEQFDFGKWDRRSKVREYGYGIADYLDRHGLGRIRRR